MLKIDNGAGVPMIVRVVHYGDSYGRNNCLKHEDQRPLVEFYDARYSHTLLGAGFSGQFISRYYADTLLSGHNPDVGLCLDGGIPDWVVEAPAYREVIKYLKVVA